MRDRINATLITISTQQIKERKGRKKESVNYPREVIEIIPELKEDLQWLIDYVEDKPTFDSSVEKLVRKKDITTTPHPDYPYFNQYRIWFEKVALDANEIEAIEDVNNDDELDNYEQLGKQIGRKCRRKALKRRNLNENDDEKLSKIQTRKILDWLYPTFLALNVGNFNIAKKEISKTSLSDDVTAANKMGITNTYNEIKIEILQYFNSKEYNI